MITEMILKISTENVFIIAVVEVDQVDRNHCLFDFQDNCCTNGSKVPETVAEPSDFATKLTNQRPIADAGLWAELVSARKSLLLDGLVQRRPKNI